jgi:hypothetical protein
VARDADRKTLEKINSTYNPMKITLSFLFAIAILRTGNLAAKSKPNAAGGPADPGWPRQRTNEQGSLVYYQPQIGNSVNSSKNAQEQAKSYQNSGANQAAAQQQKQSRRR